MSLGQDLVDLVYVFLDLMKFSCVLVMGRGQTCGLTHDFDFSCVLDDLFSILILFGKCLDDNMCLG